MNKLLVFDLDGTLIDSVGGIANSVNLLRKDFGFAPLDEKLITTFVGDGAKKLLERSFKNEVLPVSIDEAVKRMIVHYAADPLHNTTLYCGVADTLHHLRDAGYLLTVVSNKPQEVSEKILAGLGILPLLTENIGGGSGFPLKPAPDALLHLLTKYHASPENSFVIGDNHTDINAAANAEMRSVFCRFGIGNKGETVPDFEVDSFSELTAILLPE